MQGGELAWLGAPRCAALETWRAVALTPGPLLVRTSSHGSRPPPSPFVPGATSPSPKSGGLLGGLSGTSPSPKPGGATGSMMGGASPSPKPGGLLGAVSKAIPGRRRALGACLVVSCARAAPACGVGARSQRTAHAGLQRKLRFGKAAH
jgi:hypothetical protein